jgi:hypothetical protein
MADEWLTSAEGSAVLQQHRVEMAETQ